MLFWTVLFCLSFVCLGSSGQLCEPSYYNISYDDSTLNLNLTAGSQLMVPLTLFNGTYPIQPTDIYFLWDISFSSRSFSYHYWRPNSMRLKRIMNATMRANPNVRFGLGFFTTKRLFNIGNSNDFVYQHLVNITDNITAVDFPFVSTVFSQVDAVSPYTSSLEAFLQVVLTSNQTGFRPGSRRIAFIATDAMFGQEGNTGERTVSPLIQIENGTSTPFPRPNNYNGVLEDDCTLVGRVCFCNPQAFQLITQNPTVQCDCNGVTILSNGSLTSANMTQFAPGSCEDFPAVSNTVSIAQSNNFEIFAFVPSAEQGVQSEFDNLNAQIGGGALINTLNLFVALPPLVPIVYEPVVTSNLTTFSYFVVENCTLTECYILLYFDFPPGGPQTNGVVTVGNFIFSVNVTTCEDPISFSSSQSNSMTNSLSSSHSLSQSQTQSSSNSHSMSASLSNSEAETKSQSQSQTTSDSQTLSQSQSQTTSDSHTVSQSHSQTKSDSQSKSQSQSQTISNTATKSASQSQTTSVEETKSASQSQTTSESKLDTNSNSQIVSDSMSISKGITNSRSQSSSASLSVSKGITNSGSQSSSASLSASNAETKSQSQSQTTSASDSNSKSQSQSHTLSTSNTDSTSISQSHTASASNKDSTSISQSQPHSTSESDSTSNSQSLSASQSVSKKDTNSNSKSLSASQSVSKPDTNSNSQSLSASLSLSKPDTNSNSQSLSASLSVSKPDTNSYSQSSSASFSHSSVDSMSQSKSQSMSASDSETAPTVSQSATTSVSKSPSNSTSPDPSPSSEKEPNLVVVIVVITVLGVSLTCCFVFALLTRRRRRRENRSGRFRGPLSYSRYPLIN